MEANTVVLLAVLIGSAQKSQHDIKPYVQLLYRIASYGEVSFTF